MLSERTAAAIATAYETWFAPETRIGKTLYLENDFYAFLQQNAYPSWFCEQMKDVCGSPRAIRECLLKMHSGEMLHKAKPTWELAQREQLGRQLLLRLAKDLLNHWRYEPDEKRKAKLQDAYAMVLASLQLDGYAYENDQLIPVSAAAAQSVAAHGSATARQRQPSAKDDLANSV